MPDNQYSGTELVPMLPAQFNPALANFLPRRQTVLAKLQYHESNLAARPRRVVSMFFSNAAIKALTGFPFQDADLKEYAKGIMLRLAVKNNALGIISIASNGTLQFVDNIGYFNSETGNGTPWVNNLENLENAFRASGQTLLLNLPAPPVFQVSKASMLKLILDNPMGALPAGTVGFQMNMPLESHGFNIQDFLNFASVQTVDPAGNRLLGISCPPNCYE